MNSFRPLHSDNADFLPEEPLGESILDLKEAPVRVWQPKSTIVVLGRSQKAEKEIELDATKEDAIPIFKRHGGGGCVVLDENCVCIALRYNRENKNLNITDFLRHSSLGIQLFLKETYSLEVEIKENYDLVLEDRKFLGCSLYMPRGLCLYYAVLLIDRKAMAKISRYLSMPSKEPKHRGSRSHDDFLIPLNERIECSIESFVHDLEEFMLETDWTGGPAK